MKTVALTEVTFYTAEEEDDTLDSASRRDYSCVALYRGGELFKEFGDWYHDKGDVRCEAFIEGFKVGQGGDVNVTHMHALLAPYNYNAPKTLPKNAEKIDG